MYAVENGSRTSPAEATVELDPLLRDLYEKKQNFRKNVVSLAAELKDVRARLAAQEMSYAKESVTRQEAENRAKTMEEEIGALQKRLDERNGQLRTSASAAEKYLVEIEDLRSRLASTEETAETSAASAESSQLQCLILLKELNEKNDALKQQEDRVTRLGEQLQGLQQNLQARESNQKQLQDYVLRLDQDIREALARSGTENDFESTRLLEASSHNFDKIDDEIVKVKDELRVMSSHWKLKSKDLEMQLDKHRRTDQELKKKVLKLEYCLHESRAQTRKIQRIAERCDKALKDLKDQVSSKQVADSVTGNEKPKFWESSGFKVVVSMSMLLLVLFSKRCRLGGGRSSGSRRRLVPKGRIGCSDSRIR